jgi:hypothetical protein
MDDCTYVANTLDVVFSMSLELFVYFAVIALAIKLVNRIF